MTHGKAVGDGGIGITVSVSIIIATYNARERLADCLASIYQNPPSEPYEIIVVDDASGDATSEMVAQRFPDVRLFKNATNCHYAYSNNLAFQHARGQYLYLLNNDTIMLPNAVDRMIEFLRKRSDVGVVGSKLLNEDGTIQWSVKSLPNIGSALFGARSIVTRLFPNNPLSRRHLLHLDHNLSDPFIAGYVSSASMMVPSDVVRKIGGFDERLSYHVDADYCKRISDLGYLCVYLPDSAVIHLNHKGGTMVSRSRRFRSVIEFHRGSYIFFRKHIQRTAGIATCIIVPAGIFIRFIFCILTQTMTEVVSTTFVSAGEISSRLTRPKSAPPFSPELKRGSIPE